jgi:hypothetical protein
MQLLRAAAAAVLLFAAAGTAAADPGTGEPRAFRAETVWVDAPPLRHHLSHTLFVNRCVGDCQLTVGDNDARSNTSSIIPGNTTISEFDAGDQSDVIFDATVECLREVYGPYDVDIVTEDPGTETFHHEAILAGFPEEAGRDPLVGGVAPASCTPLDNVISFSFANAVAQNLSGDRLIDTLCWTLAQESAHAFGLPNHVYDCADPMTYLPKPGEPWCGRKYFRNRGIPCGDFEPTSCMCSVTEQNSHRELLAAFGPGTLPPGPAVAIQLPGPEAQVSDKFSIFFNAVDPRTVDHAEIWLNGSKYLTLPGYDYFNQDNVYSAEAPDHPDGYIDVEIRAYTDIGSVGSATVTVLKGAPCDSDDQCFEHMSCDDGRCKYPAPSGELGDSCDYDQFCVSGICAGKDSGGECSQSCQMGVEGACPDGAECIEGNVCYSGSSGGCCTVAGGHKRDERFPLVALSLFAAVLAVLRLRARARHAR